MGGPRSKMAGALVERDQDTETARRHTRGQDSHRHPADRVDRGPPASRSVRNQIRCASRPGWGTESRQPRRVATWPRSPRKSGSLLSRGSRKSGPYAGAEVLTRLPERAFDMAASFRTSQPREAYSGVAPLTHCCSAFLGLSMCTRRVRVSQRLLVFLLLTQFLSQGSQPRS